jgi:ATP-binding cassette subfamily B protein
MHSSADAIYRIQYDAAAIEWVVVYGISPFVTAILTLGGMIVVTAALDWQIAIVALAATPVLFVLTQFFRRRLRAVWTEVKEIESSELAIIQEILAALRVVKAFGQEDREQRRFVTRSGESVVAHLRVVLTESAFSVCIGLTVAVGTAAVLFLGVNHVEAGILTLGQFLLLMAYLAQLYQPLETIGHQIATLQGGLASADRAFKLLDQLVEVSDSPAAKSIVRAHGAVRFDKVGFSYDQRNDVLSGVTFDVPPGTRVGIVGRTGAGKTTLVNLLLRFYDPVHGRVSLDGVDLRDYRVADLRDQFSVVLQEPILFSRSIAENIAYGRPGVSMAEVMQAAKAAHADEFIGQLPEGYETRVGERGMRLSGGERQRIALARAFLKDAPVVVLDEPTSSVDVKTEAIILDAMERLMHGRTTFIIAHRLNTLDGCHLLLHVENGQVRRIEPGGARDERHRLVEALYDRGDVAATHGSE